MCCKVGGTCNWQATRGLGPIIDNMAARIPAFIMKKIAETKRGSVLVVCYFASVVSFNTCFCHRSDHQVFVVELGSC